MSAFKFNYEHPLSIGAPVAEQETDYLRQHFVPIPINTDVRAENSSIIRGRKGSGKTALRIVFDSSADGDVIIASIYPEAREIEAAYQYLTSDTSSSFFATEIQTLWELAVYISIARQILRNFENHGQLVNKIRGEILDFDITNDSSDLKSSFSAAMILMKTRSGESASTFLFIKPVLDSLRGA